MKIKSDEKLFNDWKQLGFQISILGSIVQNDMEMLEKDYLKWEDLVYRLNVKFQELTNRTKEIIDQ